MKRYSMRDFLIFWDNGKFVAVATGPDGVRRNFAPYNCQTKTEATQAARETIEDFNAQEETT